MRSTAATHPRYLTYTVALHNEASHLAACRKSPPIHSRRLGFLHRKQSRSTTHICLSALIRLRAANQHQKAKHDSIIYNVLHRRAFSCLSGAAVIASVRAMIHGQAPGCGFEQPAMPKRCTKNIPHVKTLYLPPSGGRQRGGLSFRLRGFRRCF